jgi:hypothetical protein
MMTIRSEWMDNVGRASLCSFMLCFVGIPAEGIYSTSMHTKMRMMADKHSNHIHSKRARSWETSRASSVRPSLCRHLIRAFNDDTNFGRYCAPEVVSSSLYMLVASWICPRAASHCSSSKRCLEKSNMDLARAERLGVDDGMGEERSRYR